MTSFSPFDDLPTASSSEAFDPFAPVRQTAAPTAAALAHSVPQDSSPFDPFGSPAPPASFPAAQPEAAFDPFLPSQPPPPPAAAGAAPPLPAVGAAIAAVPAAGAAAGAGGSAGGSFDPFSPAEAAGAFDPFGAAPGPPAAAAFDPFAPTPPAAPVDDPFGLASPATGGSTAQSPEQGQGGAFDPFAPPPAAAVVAEEQPRGSLDFWSRADSQQLAADSPEAEDRVRRSSVGSEAELELAIASSVQTYDVTFPHETKLGMLLERIDEWDQDRNKKKERTVR